MINLSEIFNNQLILLLTEATAQEIHQQFYPNIPDDVFNQIVNADTITSNLQNNKLGAYAKWLLTLYKNNNLKLEDLYKAKEYIPVFEKMAKANKLSNKDINTYKSLADVYQVIKPYFDSKQSISRGDEERKIKEEGAEKVYEDNQFLVIHPKTKEAAVYYGKGTQWCTAATKGDNYFDEYNSKGPLYIVIDKQNNRKYQFHFEEEQFMDETDSPIEFNKHKELLPIVGKLFPKNKIETDGNGIIKLDNNYGLINKNGNWLLKPKYEYIGEAESDENRRVMLNNKYGLLNKNGKWVLKPEFNMVFSLDSDGNRVVQLDNGNCGLMDKNGKWVLNPEFNMIWSLGSDKNRQVKLNGKYGLLNSNGDWLLKPEFDEISNFSDDDDTRIVKLNGKEGLINKIGDWILKPEFDKIHRFNSNDDTRIVISDKKYGLINKNGDWLLKPDFDEIFYSDDETRYVKLNGKYGLINIIDGKLKWILKPEFDYIDNLEKDENRVVQLNGKYGLVDKNGKWVLKPEYKTIGPLQDNGSRFTRLS